MLKKIICCVIGFSMIASVLAGCSGDNATTTQKAVTESETITTTESSEPVTLNILKADAQQQQQWEELGEEYNKQFPNVTLNFQSIDNDIWSILKTKLNAGEPPDLFVVTGYNYMNVYKDYLLDLTNEPFVENFDEQMLAPSKVDGKILGVPMELTIGGLIYNKKMFADAGIAELPKTLSELEEACKKLEAKGYTPFSNGYKEFWVFKHIMVHYMGQEIGDPATIADELNAGTKTFADLPLTSQFFDFIDLSMKYAAPKSLETGFLDQVNAFAGEKVAMTAQGTWCESQILQINPDIEMGFLPVPVLEDASKSKLMVGPFWEYCIAKDGQNIEASKAFLNWLITSEYGQKFFSENLKLATAVVGTEFPKTQLAEDAQKYIAQDATVTTVQLLWPDGYEQKQGDAFQKVSVQQSMY